MGLSRRKTTQVILIWSKVCRGLLRVYRCHKPPINRAFARKSLRSTARYTGFDSFNFSRVRRLYFG
jgi:hypothetical protein